MSRIFKPKKSLTPIPKPLSHREQLPGKADRKFYHNVLWSDDYGTYSSRDQCGINQAEVVSSSLVGSKMHAPALDIDLPAWLIPSSTSGHNHLYLDRELTWRQYKRLLKALGRAGILEKGYVKASIKRKETHLRVPWVDKNSR